MNKRLCAWMAIALACAVACALVGCSEEGQRSAPSSQQSVQDVLQDQAQQADEKPSTSASFIGDTAPAVEQVNYDLTVMSADMVYATVANMMENYADYEGKTVRMKGPYYHTYYDVTDADYFYVVVEDAAACCSQGLEFVWGDGSHVYPAEYPQDGTEVIVTGTVETYSEEETTYIHLINASLQAA